MSYYVVWMDSDEAKIFEFIPGEVKKHHIEIESEERRTALDRTHHKPKEPVHFYHKLINQIKNAHEILMVGPGLAKTHFVHHLENHNHHDLRKKVVGVEDMDHPTDNQIVAQARKFFRAHDLFESI